MSRQDMSTTVRPSHGPTPSRPKLALHLLGDRRITRVIDQPFLAGRSAECEVSVPDDDACSRVHLKIAPCDSGAQIIDLGSSNGTFVDGARVDGSATIARGVLRFGDCVAVIAPSHDEDAFDAVEAPLVGGAALASIKRIVSLTAPTELPILISGETGTGKEVIARWVHQLSRRPGPLIAVNCAALPESLLEAELFGHVKGAFTGATQARRGLVAAAEGGTLFLDELGEMPLAVQAKLLRVLEDRVVRPIGAEGGAGEQVDFRVLSATNVDLPAAVERGAFRADLYARLGAVTIAMPPLRAHLEDLSALLEHLLRRIDARARLSADALEAIARYSWPQNVRQLDYALRRAIALSPARIELEHLPDEVRAGFRGGSAPARVASSPGRTSITREQLEAALRAHHGNVRRVGQALGIPRSRLYRLLSKWSIDPIAHRAGTPPASRKAPP